MPARLATVALSLAAAASVSVAACSTAPPAASRNLRSDHGRVIAVAASINAWGSILSQLGGSHVTETSIITNPDTDPHAYEPTPADARTIASARLFLENGIGYDPWAAQAATANPDSSRSVVNVGQVVHVAVGGNPHRWYSPQDVQAVADAITIALKKIDPGDAAYFGARRAAFETVGLARYHQLTTAIRSRYAGTVVGASESIFAPLANALGLNLVTPAGFLKSTSEGTDPSPKDLSTIASQIADKVIKVYVFNSQNSTPDVAAQVAAARAKGIPVSSVTETLSPANASFQDWQCAQLQALQAALSQAMGR
ncbi:MAG: zinc ABC transporter substrate-binding protein [Actinomycetota bacterium]|nr:zinc ABC transporter substrate-binding protein [Actinomycetota bacterium]